MSNTKQPSKFSRFLRNNAALLLLIFCVLAITAVVLSVTLTQKTAIPDDPVVNNPNDDDKPDEPPVKETIRVFFESPVQYTSFGLGYTDGEVVKGIYRATLKEISAHTALDLLAADGTNVTAMYDGIVVETGYKYGIGNYVIIDHGDNVIATYASLGNVDVQEHEQVKKGEVIGTVSTTARSEFLDGGAHLHLEITKNGSHVDPTPYVKGEVYRDIEQ